MMVPGLNGEMIPPSPSNNFYLSIKRWVANFRVNSLPMRKFLLNLSIQKRLTLIMVSTALCVVFIGAVLLIDYDYGRIREQLAQETNVATRVMAQDFAKVLLFDRQDIASDVIFKLSEFPMVLRADLYDTTGNLRLRYARKKDDNKILPNNPQTLFDGTRMYIHYPVIIQGTQLGNVRFAISTEKLQYMIKQMYILLAIYIPCALVFVILAAMYLQRFFTRPLLHLTWAVSEVTETQDFSLRLDENDRSEFGILNRGFNQLMKAISAANTKLSYRASHDSLTGLKNRFAFEQRLKELVNHCREDDIDSVFVYMDLDQFKVVNDTCGHLAGDALLRQLSQLLASKVRSGDYLARLGGDEFGILLDHCPMDQACIIAESLLSSFSQFRFTWDDQIFKIGISIGMVAIDAGVNDIISLFSHADTACYAAKEGGRNQYYIFNKEDEHLNRQKTEMGQIAVISRAIDENRLVLYAQPIRGLGKNSDHKHYEVLIRMQNRDGTLLSPGAFLPGAERYGLIEQIDRWVVKNLLTTLQNHPSLYENCGFFSLNLSGLTIGRHDFLPFLNQQFCDNKEIARKICIEITETAAIGNVHSVLPLMKNLKALGVRFALDDFGTGMSSFSYLKTLPVDYLKIDGQFVREIHTDPLDHAMVKSINEIAHTMGIKTIAEFVENEEIVKQLIVIGIDYGQGYHLGRPAPLMELLN